MPILSRKYIFKWSIFHCHDSLPEGNTTLSTLNHKKTPWYLSYLCRLRFQGLWVCIPNFEEWFPKDTVDGKIRLISWYSKYPILYKVLYIPGGAGFLPSAVTASQESKDKYRPNSARRCSCWALPVVLRCFCWSNSPCWQMMPAHQGWSTLCWKITLQGINMSHLGKRKSSSKLPWKGDMLVPRRVVSFSMSFLEVIEYTEPMTCKTYLFTYIYDICIYVCIHDHTYAYMAYHIEYTHTQIVPIFIISPF